MAKFGRPTKYKPEYCQQLVDFFRQDCIKEVEITVEGKNWSKTVTDLVPVFFPTFEEFADNIDTHVDTLHEWRRRHKDFSEAYTRAKDRQKAMLLKFSLLGRLDTRFAQFMAINNFGMVSAKTENKGEGEIIIRKYEELTDDELIAASAVRNDSPARTLG